MIVQTPNSPSMSEEDNFVNRDLVCTPVTTVTSHNADNNILWSPIQSLNFGPESFLTPEAQESPNYLEHTPTPRKLCLSDRDKCKRIKIGVPQTSIEQREMEYNKEITVPSIAFNRGFRTIESKEKSFFLQPRKHISTSNLCIKRKITLPTGPWPKQVSEVGDVFEFFKNMRPTIKLRKHKLEKHAFFADFCHNLRYMYRLYL